MENCVAVPVCRALRDYLVNTTGSTLIHPAKTSVIWAVVKQYLICYTERQAELRRHGPEDPQECIYIGLLQASSCKTYSRMSDNIISINTDCRQFLSFKGQRVIARLLNNEFAKTYLDYMAGATANNPELNIKDIISNFCDQYSLDFPSVYEMLKKRWYRFRAQPRQLQNSLINF